MTNSSLFRAYYQKAGHRRKVLDLLFAEGAWSDVVREAQEMVELLLKGMLRKAGVEPPKWHDVGKPLIRFADRFPEAVRHDIERLAAISARLRKERELAFYGDIDFIPTEEYSEADARQAMEEAGFVYQIATLLADPANDSAARNQPDAGDD